MAHLICDEGKHTTRLASAAVERLKAEYSPRSIFVEDAPEKTTRTNKAKPISCDDDLGTEKTAVRKIIEAEQMADIGAGVNSGSVTCGVLSIASHGITIPLASLSVMSLLSCLTTFSGGILCGHSPSEAWSR